MNKDYLEIPIGPYCSKKCLFCAEGGKGNRQILKYLDFEELLNNIEKNRIGKVVFSTGEPILNKDLFNYIKLCSDKGIKSSIVTAWEKGFGEDFIKKLIAFGLNELMFSIEGMGKIHDFLVQKDGAFKEILKALIILKKINKKDLKVIIHINLNIVNYKNIVNLINFLGKNFNFIEKFYIQVLEPVGNAKINYKILMKKYGDFLPYFFDDIDKNLNIYLRNKIELGILPFCVVPEKFHNILGSCLNIYDGNLSTKELIKDEHYDNLKYHSDKCLKCSKYKNCNLFFKYYIEIFGDEEIKQNIN